MPGIDERLDPLHRVGDRALGARRCQIVADHARGVEGGVLAERDPAGVHQPIREQLELLG